MNLNCGEEKNLIASKLRRKKLRQNASALPPGLTIGKGVEDPVKGRTHPHHRRRRLTRLLCCLLALLLLPPLPVSAAVDDELSEYAAALARERGYQVGGQLSKGSGSGQFEVNSTSASTDRSLYVVEVYTTVAYEQNAGNTSNCHMDFALFYLGGDLKVYWTDDFEFNGASQDFMGNTAALKANQMDAVSIQLPNNCREILAVYFSKDGGPLQGKNEWAASYLRVAKVSGTIGAVKDDGLGYKYRDFQGIYMAGVSDLNQLNYYGWGSYLWRLNWPEDNANNSSGKSVYAVELVTGGDGYDSPEGTVTVNYTDSLGISYDCSITLWDGYYTRVGGWLEWADPDVTSPWLTTTAAQMRAMGNFFTGNDYSSNSCLQPYTSTTLQMTMPQNISRINSITVALQEDDQLNLQSVRFYELSATGDYYRNGMFAKELTQGWQGRVLAQSTGGPYTVLGKNSITFTNSSLETLGLRTYARGQGPLVDNSGEGVGVSIQIADAAGAGVESLLAHSSGSLEQDGNYGTGWEQLKSQASDDASKAYQNLAPLFQEFMNLEITYLDVFGSTRKVSVPFFTTYMACILKQNDGRLTGGTWETWISGILQQNENAALSLPLAQYDSLVGLRLTYGTAPDGLSNTYSNFKTVDTASDTITVENLCFYEGVTESNFVNKYDTEKLACVLDTSLSPAYSWSSSSGAGQKLSTGSSISASLSAENLSTGAPTSLRDFSSSYVVRIKTADIETADTDDPVSVSITYTNQAGQQQNTSVYSLQTLADNFYGASYCNAPANYQYALHMRRNCLCEFTVDLPGAATIDAITLTLEGANEWQVEYVSVYKLSGLEQRRGEREGNGLDESQIYWQRDFDESNLVASARQSVLLYANSPSKTIWFTTVDEEGNETAPEQPVKEEEYLTSLPTSMTYNDALKNLGLSIVKCTYQINVNVADVEDAGSSNYFYFQLVFENGTSAVVLANQQLSSDSFRQGMTESFQIKATQNYGNVTAVRIICDNTSSTSDVFDKLNIESISVTLNSSSGISKTWLVERVGWIDITYVDEGADYGVDGLEEFSENDGLSNEEIVKEFGVTRTATAVDLLFCISTSAASAPDSSSPLDNALQGRFEATLIYRDSDGMEQSMNFDLTAKIQEYNDTDKTSWLYRPNHVDRFTLSMTDISSVLGLTITRTGGRSDTQWVVDAVSVQQVGGLGEVYLSPVLTEYMRDPSSAVDLAVSTNESGVPYVISGDGNATITFTENTIDVVSQEDSESWNATISRVPESSSETLNIYLFPGSTIGSSYTFTSSSPAVRATVKYTTVYGGSLVQNSFVLGNLGQLNGQTVLYGKGLKVSAMSSLSTMLLSSTSAGGEQPYIGTAVVERVRGGVVMATYYFDYGSYYLGNGNPESAPSSTLTATAMHQVLHLQPASGQAAVLTAETSDVAVALRYTSSLDPAENKTVYQTPYVYLTDAGYAAVLTGQRLEIPFSASNVGDVVGLSVISSGPIVSFDNALVYNYAGQEGDDSSLLGACYLAQTFTASSITSVLSAQEETVVPAVFRFTTAAEEVAGGAATSGQVSMTVRYMGNSGQSRTMTFDDLLSYLPTDVTPTAGSTVEVSLLLNDAAYLQDIILTAQDSWFVTAASADLTLPDGQLSSSATTVNNWADSDGLTVDLRPDAYRDTPNAGNFIQSFSVTGRGRQAGAAASASAGSSLLVTAYVGDIVDLTPVITAVGNPDTSWSWNTGAYGNNLTIQSDGAAAFYVPYNASPGDTFTFSVTCNGDNRLTVPITVSVEEKPAPEVILDLGGGSGASEGETSSVDGA